MKTKTQLTNRILSLVLAFVMVLGMLPLSSFTAFAAATDLTVNITGADGNPKSVTLQDADGNGYYEISTAETLLAFAKAVNDGSNSINAELTADIDLTGYEWTTICETGLYYGGYGEDLGYCGTFDGNGHIIKNITVKSSTTMDASCGLFGTVSGTIKNLGIEGFTFVDGGKDIRAGAIVGQLITANGKVSNCYVKGATITPGEHVTGGIAGCVYEATIENCYVVESTITGTEERFGHVVGDSRGDINESDRPGTVTNCYSDNTTLRSDRKGNVINCETKSKKAFAGGEVTYLLNGSKSDGKLVWYQTIGTDAIPKFAGGTVYEASCVGNEYYSNKKEHYETHDFVEGFCSRCGEPTPAKQNSDGYYEIGNVGQLYWFAQQVNGGNTAINGELTADIVVNENVLTEAGELNDTGKDFRVWTPIGTFQNRYSGTFDGAEHTISGLYIHNNVSSMGLFGYVDSSGTVRNVGVEDCYFECDSWVGGIVGENYGTITNCYNTGTVIGYNNVGGIAGENWNNGTTTNCYNAGTVIGTNQCAGGIVGRNRDGGSTIRNCYNTGAVTGSGATGGIVGNNYAGTTTNCYNIGTVTGNWSEAGGVAGYNYKGTIANCYNIGTVTSTKPKIGGIAGFNHTYGIITNCYNIGTVTGESEIGGIAGENWDNGTITNCYYLAGSAGVGIGKDSASHKTVISAVSEAQVKAASGEDDALVDMLNAWVAQSNDAAYSEWHLCTAQGALEYPALGNFEVITCLGRLCKLCGEYYGTKDPSNHASTDFVYLPDTENPNLGHNQYHVCCGVLIEDSRKNHDCDPVTGERVDYLYSLIPLDDSGKYVITAQCRFCHTDGGEPYVAGKQYVTMKDKTYDGMDCRYGTDGEEGVLTDVQGFFCCSGGCTNAGEHTLTFLDSIVIHFTIAPAPLSVTANNVTVEQYDKFPEFTYTAEGFLTYMTPGDMEVTDGFITEPTVKVLDRDGNEVTDTRTLGTYRIVFSGGVNDNYEITYYEGTLTVEHTEHSFEGNNGFCPSGCYEPALLNSDEYYEIGNAGQLFWFAQQVNSGAIKKTSNAVLKADIDLESRAWTPITNFSGTFDGAGHAIKNFAMNITAKGDHGLFGFVKNATIKDFTIYGEVESKLTAKPDDFKYGVIADATGDTTITDVHSYVNFTIKDSYFRNFVGGILGRINDAGANFAIERCSFSGKLNLGAAQVDCTGGIVAYVYADNIVKLNNCLFDGKIISTYNSAMQVGGFLGYYRGSGLTVTNSLSIGGISVSNKTYMGALIGILRQHSSANQKVTNNYYLEGDQPFGNSTNNDDITDSGSGQKVELSATAVTDSQLKSGEIAYLLQGEQESPVWGQTCGEGLPTLDGAKVYGVTDCKGNPAYSNTNVSGEHIDADRNGLCDICGEKISSGVDSWNLSLHGDIRVNFLLKLASEDAAVEITVDGESFRFTASDMTMEGDLYKATVGIAAAQMTRPITVKILEDGETKFTETYTARQYCDTILADESHSQYHILVREMLNYGAMAQTYFGYDAEDLANDGITGVAAQNVPETAEELVVSDNIGGLNFYGASLVYRDRIAVRFYFTGDITGCTFTANGNTYTPVSKDGRYYVEISDILPQDMDKQITLTVTDANGNALSATYGPMNYIVRMNGKGSAALQNLVKALYNYHLAAKALQETV